ncbi:DNA polymerase III, subunits gamma and tau [Burkholderia pseudomallei 576]|nr:DNA polymerase III, subunits gamma and tau [Burkholderia pseudomallei 576]
MTYQVLARKWRPKDFASLVGQEHVVRALTHALDGGRLHHAYLFTGTRGVGKTTLSRIFAKALNCETGVTSQPCGVCRACREIDEGRFVDYVEMDAASNRGVDEMAALLERAVYAPVDARFKVYMIDEVHMLTNHAFNAMLKTLEEPPPHVKFILATTDPQKIPVTVLSRCLQFNLKQMPAGHIVSHLERILGEERIAFEPQALRLLARAAQGSMRDALSLTDQAIAYSANEVTETAVSGMLGTLDQTYMVRLLDALAAADGPQILAVADEMALRSLSFSAALQDLAGLLHRIAWAQFAPASVLDEWPEAADLRRFAELLSPEQVQLYYQIATVGRGELGLAPDEYAGFTMTLLRMLAFEPATTGGGAPAGGVPARVAGAAPKSGARAAAAVGASAVPAATGATGAALAPKAAAARAATRAEAPPAAPARPATAERGDDASDGDAPVPAKANARASADSRCDERDAQPPADSGSASGASSSAPPDTAFESAPRAAAPSAATPAAVPDARAPAAASAEDAVEAAAPAAPESRPPTPAAGAPVSRATGAAAALDVLRNAGMRVSSGARRRRRAPGRRAGRVAGRSPRRACRCPCRRRAPARQPATRRRTAPRAPKREPSLAARRRRGRTSRPTITCRCRWTMASSRRTTVSFRCSTAGPTMSASRRSRPPRRPSTRARCRSRFRSMPSATTANGRRSRRACRSRASPISSRSTAS